MGSPGPSPQPANPSQLLKTYGQVEAPTTLHNWRQYRHQYEAKTQFASIRTQSWRRALTFLKLIHPDQCRPCSTSTFGRASRRSSTLSHTIRKQECLDEHPVSLFLQDTEHNVLGQAIGGVQPHMHRCGGGRAAVLPRWYNVIHTKGNTHIRSVRHP